MIKLEKIDTLVIDTGVLVEFLRNTKMGILFQTKFLTPPPIQYFYLNPLTYTELLYIFCREFGMKKAEKILEDKLKNFLIIDEDVLRSKAAELKCRFGIALVDCYSIASGHLKNCPVLMKKEQELSKIDISKISAPIIFIDDFMDNIP
jgi:predicted nucleic acid-binding protein